MPAQELSRFQKTAKNVSGSAKTIATFSRRLHTKVVEIVIHAITPSSTSQEWCFQVGEQAWQPVPRGRRVGPPLRNTLCMFANLKVQKRFVRGYHGNS